jgi:hypothetical protein
MNNDVSEGVCMSRDHCSEDVLQENGYNTIEICLEVYICPEEWISSNINVSEGPEANVPQLCSGGTDTIL